MFVKVYRSALFAAIVSIAFVQHYEAVTVEYTPWCTSCPVPTDEARYPAAILNAMQITQKVRKQPAAPKSFALLSTMDVELSSGPALTDGDRAYR